VTSVFDFMQNVSSVSRRVSGTVERVMLPRVVRPSLSPFVCLSGVTLRYLGDISRAMLRK